MSTMNDIAGGTATGTAGGSERSTARGTAGHVTPAAAWIRGSGGRLPGARRLLERSASRDAHIPSGRRLGIAVASESIRVVAVERGVVRWATEVPWSVAETASSPQSQAFSGALADEPAVTRAAAGVDARLDARVDAIAEALTDALASAPRGTMQGAWLGLGRPVAIAAVGLGAAQLRRLAELPQFTDSRLVERAVREGSGRFFLRNGVPLATTGVRPVEAGTAWAGAIEEPVLTALSAVCRRAGVRLRAVVPAPVALARVATDGDIVWRDGATASHVTAVGGQVVNVRRVPVVEAPSLATHAAAQVPVATHASTVPASVPPGARPDVGAATPAPAPLELSGLASLPALGALGPEGWRFADAYGAAILPMREPLAVRPSGAAAGGAVPRWRRTLAWAVALLSLAAALAAPGLRALHDARQASSALATLGTTARAIALTERALAETDARLHAHAAFDAGRHSALELLDQLTQALPDGATLVALRLDSAGGAIMALTPRAGALVVGLDTLPLIASVEVLGPVTRERIMVVSESGGPVGGAVGATPAISTPGRPTPPGAPATLRELERVSVRFRWARTRAASVPAHRAVGAVGGATGIVVDSTSDGAADGIADGRVGVAP